MIRHTLGNGIRVVAEPIPTSRSVSFGIWVKNGSRHENAGNNGISHLIEHMIFKGTKKRSARDIADVFDGIGGDVNAFTAKEYTCYYFKVLDEYFPIALDVLSDMFFHSVFDERELHKEKQVVLEEIAMYEDTPDDYVHDLIARAAYGDHPLAYPILGTESVLNRLEREDLFAYRRNHYGTDAIVISAAGHLHERFLELVEEHFGHDRARSEERNTAAPVFQSGIEFFRKKTEQDHICLSLPGVPFGDERMYAMILLNNVIGGTMSSRLFQEIREKRGWAYSIYSYHTAHQDSGLMTIYAGTAPKQSAQVISLTLEVLRKIAADGISEQELERGKAQMKGNMILSLESTSSRMNRLGKHELMLGRHMTIDEMLERIDGITPDDIAGLTRHMFAQPLALAVVGRDIQTIEQVRGDLHV